MARQKAKVERRKKDKDWPITANRFVAFFDILGFKEMVLKSTHTNVLRKLSRLRSEVLGFRSMSSDDFMKPYGVARDQVHSVTFSDSIILFSKGDELRDAIKILVDTYGILSISLDAGIPIKGALSYGKTTVDLKKSLFFGQPIIDAFQLHEELQMLTTILDEKAERKLNSMRTDPIIDRVLVNYRASLKSGKVTHKLMMPLGNEEIDNWLEAVKKLYGLTAGRPRVYIDNTVDFIQSLKAQSKT